MHGSGDFRSGIVAALLSALPLAACGSSGDKIQGELRAMETQLTALRADQDRVEERLEALELRAAVRAQQANAIPAESPPTERPRLKTIRLGPDGTGGPVPDEAKPLPEPARAVPASAESEPLPARPVIRGQGDRVFKTNGESSRGPDVKAEYESLLALVRSGSYTRAVRGLKSFLRRYPTHDYTDNALYWMAECEAARGHLDVALKHFDDLLLRHPYGNKVADARVRRDRISEQLGGEPVDRLRARLSGHSWQEPVERSARR